MGYKLQGKQKFCSECGEKLVIKSEVMTVNDKKVRVTVAECPNGVGEQGWDGHDYYHWETELDGE